MTPKQEQKHTDLLPCPFCGGAPYMRKHAGIVDMVRCAVCRFQLRETQWNTRKADCHEELVSALQEALAALKHCSKSFSAISEQAQKMGMSLSDPEIIANLGLTISETVDVLARATNHQGSK